MFIVYVKHYLSDDGIKYFCNTWFPMVQAIMSKQHCYISVSHDVKRDSNKCINIIVTFNDQKNLEEWAEHKDHERLVILLNPYRCKDYWEFACTDDPSLIYEKLHWEKVILSL